MEYIRNIIGKLGIGPARQLLQTRPNTNDYRNLSDLLNNGNTNIETVKQQVQNGMNVSQIIAASAVVVTNPQIVATNPQIVAANHPTANNWSAANDQTQLINGLQSQLKLLNTKSQSDNINIAKKDDTIKKRDELLATDKGIITNDVNTINSNINTIINANNINSALSATNTQQLNQIGTDAVISSSILANLYTGITEQNQAMHDTIYSLDTGNVDREKTYYQNQQIYNLAYYNKYLLYLYFIVVVFVVYLIYKKEWNTYLKLALGLAFVAYPFYIGQLENAIVVFGKYIYSILNANVYTPNN